MGSSPENPERPLSGNLAYHLAQDRMALIPRYYAWVASRIAPWLGGRLLDLGCGAGLIYRHYLALVDEILAVDHNPAVLEALRARYPCDTVRTLQQDLRGAWNGIPPGIWDTVVALDVLEHFEDDRSIVRKMRTALAPQGLMIVKVPGQPQLFSAVDRASGHFRRYDRTSLESLMHASGMSTVSLREINPVGALVYRFKRSRESNFSRSLPPAVLATANVVMPLLALLDHVPGLRGLSLIGVYRRAERDGDPEGRGSS